jgi:hypothetical protein
MLWRESRHCIDLGWWNVFAEALVVGKVSLSKYVRLARRHQAESVKAKSRAFTSSAYGTLRAASRSVRDWTSSKLGIRNLGLMRY